MTGEALLTPTKIYVKPVLSVLKNHTVRAISHVTGGGFYEYSAYDEGRPYGED